MRKSIVIIVVIVLMILLNSCVALKPYERIYVNDPLMQLGNNHGRNFQDYVHSIREGSTPAGSTKSSGGCGCN